MLAQRDRLTAQLAEVQARDAYAKAKVAWDQALGLTLESSHVTLDEMLRGRSAPSKGNTMIDRRAFLVTAGAAIAASRVRAQQSPVATAPDPLRAPDQIVAFAEGESTAIALTRSGERWQARDIEVSREQRADGAARLHHRTQDEIDAHSFALAWRVSRGRAFSGRPLGALLRRSGMAWTGGRPPDAVVFPGLGWRCGSTATV
ncbi:MAG: hypothetical protein WDO73_01320 [Ignavibacteriota bacterium]